jgi:pre-mRNA-splicing factor SPF27
LVSYYPCASSLYYYYHHHHHRNNNINLLSTYGPNAHLIQNYALEAEATELESVVSTHQHQVTELNRARRIYQEKTGEHLTRLESRWQDLVGGVVQLEMAGVVLKGRVEDLRRKRDELKLEIEEIEMQE